MICSTCNQNNPEANLFCGTCGNALEKNLIDIENHEDTRISKKIDLHIERKLSGLVDLELLEFKATDRVIKSVWVWLARFFAVFAVAFGALGIWGVTSVDKLRSLQDSAENEFEEAIEKAKTLNKNVDRTNSKIDEYIEGFIKKVTEADDLIKGAEVDFNKMKNLTEKYKMNLDELDEKINAADQTVIDYQERMIVAVEDIKQRGDGISDIAEKTAILVQKIAETSVDVSVDTLTKSVEASLIFDKAFNMTDIDEKIKLYTDAAEADPEYSLAYYFRANAYLDKSLFKEAISDFDKAILIDPLNSSAINDKAWLLATATDLSFRNGDEAKNLALRAIAIENDADYQDTLAAAYAELGQFEEAVNIQADAIEMLISSEQDGKIPRFQKSLDLYADGKKYRE